MERSSEGKIPAAKSPSSEKSGSGGTARRPFARKDRRDLRRPQKPSLASAAAQILEVLPVIERALTKPEFEILASNLKKIIQIIAPFKLKGIDDIDDFDARTHLFTVLTRTGWLKPSQDPKLESLRRDALAAAGEVWLALGDEKKGTAVLNAAGRPEHAIISLERQGNWRDAAARAREAGLLKMAAQILEAHGEKNQALDLRISLGDFSKETLRMAVSVGDTEKAMTAARGMDYAEAKRILSMGGMAQAALELAAEKGDWKEVARIYSRAGQHADAAKALVHAGDIHGAIESFRRGGMTDEAIALVKSESERLLSQGNSAGAGEFLRRHGMLSEAVALIRTENPELAFSWLQRGGLRDQARAFAAEMAGRMDEKGDRAASALWLSRSGQHCRAAEIWLSLDNQDEAMKEYEAGADWNKALNIALAQGLWPKIQSFCARGKIPIPEDAFPRRSRGTSRGKTRHRHRRNAVAPQTSNDSAAQDSAALDAAAPEAAAPSPEAASPTSGGNVSQAPSKAPEPTASADESEECPAVKADSLPSDLHENVRCGELKNESISSSEAQNS